MAKLTTIYWRDIPAQVIAKKGRTSVKQPLSVRFTHAIDRAAMRAGKGSSDAYLAEWRRESENIEGDMQDAVNQRVAQLEKAFTDEVLLETIRRKGFSATPTAARENS